MMATWSESEESSEEENEKEVTNMCFMAIDDLDKGSKKDKWFLDSGCSRHMTGNESKFAFLTKRKGGYFTFGDNAKGRIIGQGNIDVDFVGCKVERKCTSDTCHFLGHSLVSWHSKKQNSVALTTAKAEYIAAETSLGKILDQLQALEWILGRSEARASDLGLRAFNLGQFFLSPFEGLFIRMGWLPVVTIFEPIFPTLVFGFYSRVTYGLGGPITSTVRGVEIILSPDSICRIFDIPSVGLRVYESKAWPTVSCFKPREAI
ncbi:hypothetical protein CK203_056003 [Vitis vinifera]|uniref:Retrovirus-related Pol polyprotein from transposon TNT 1-94-like beta-barrel domain-containing protein n=1 Tax=Vitis vinifera TaxID=29760 RepID=A0A438GS76_VITVI|nr:hypothetical protein CK203_056003 [Vitis vinifera]